MSIKYPIRFKAAVLVENHKPLVVDEVEFAGPLEAGQVLVRIHYSGICGKQMEEIDASAGPDKFLPHMLGHEGSGEVVGVGPGVKTVQAGDTVVLHWLKGVGIDADTPYYTRGGERVNAGWITTFNEYGVISENRLTVIKKDANMKVAALLGCAVTTGVGVVIHEANLRPAESIAVFGCGGVGLSAVLGARLVNGYPIIAVDKNMESLELAQKLGAHYIIRAEGGNEIDEIKTITDGKGVDVVIVASANPEALETAPQASGTPGKVFFAAVPPANCKITMEALALHRQRKLDGSFGGGTIPERDIPRYMDFYERGVLDLEGLITYTVTLDNINEGVEQVKAGKVGRCIIEL